MIVLTIDNVPGREIGEALGIVEGEIVQTKHIGNDLLAGLKTIVGGEVKGYTDMMEQARKVSTERMIEQATKLGADAIIGVKYSSSEIMQGASEILAYGTAVKLK